MNTEDKKLIDGLAERLKNAAAEPVEPEAVKYVTDTVAAQPNAVYRLTQAVLLQELALNQQKEELEKMRNQSSSFLDKFLGARSAPKTAGATAAAAPSFLQSAASTAMGVAGGALLFSGIKNLLGSPAQAATPETQDHDDWNNDHDDFGGSDDFGGFDD